MEKVIKLAESALEKGLDKEQQDFAKKLLAATLYQHANRSVESLVERGRRNPRLATIRTQALKDLEKAKKSDPTLPDVYLLEAKLQAFPGGDLKSAVSSASEAIKLLAAKDDPKQLSKAYILHEQLTKDQARNHVDFDTAMQTDIVIQVTSQTI